MSTLDAADDYIMTVTTISGPAKTSEDVTIHNKYYQPPEEESPSCTLPLLDTCRSSSPASTSGFDERSIESIFNSPLRQIEAVYDEVCREVSQTPLPDLEEIVKLDIAPAAASSDLLPSLPEPESVVERRAAAFLLVKKPIVPEVVYKWQRGFRRDSSGRYGKVREKMVIMSVYQSSCSRSPSSSWPSTSRTVRSCCPASSTWRPSPERGRRSSRLSLSVTVLPLSSLSLKKKMKFKV